MYQFINNIITFFQTLVNSIFTSMSNQTGTINPEFLTWVDKNIFSGDLIYINLTYRELLRYVIPIFFCFFIIFLFIRFFLKLLKVITN